MDTVSLITAFAMGRQRDKVSSQDRTTAALVAGLMPQPVIGIVTAKSMLDTAEDNATRSTKPSTKPTTPPQGGQQPPPPVIDGLQDQIKEARRDAATAARDAKSAREGVTTIKSEITALKQSIKQLNDTVAALAKNASQPAKAAV